MDPSKKIGQFYERTQIAKQIKDARKNERSVTEDSLEKYPTDRDYLMYWYSIGGLKYVFEYLKTLPSNIVLDIGTGTGKAASEMSRSRSAQGLDVHATSLRNDPELQKNFPDKTKLHITSVETLRGIERSSVGTVLAMCSIAYANYPKLAIQKIDEVLVPGGVLKANFSPGSGHAYGDVIFKSSDVFVETLHSLGYDVDVSTNNIYLKKDDHYAKGKALVVLAIKPGNPNAPTAKELRILDQTEMNKGSEERADGYRVIDVTKNLEIA
jgi:SAM-dependent methyltransferase